MRPFALLAVLVLASGCAVSQTPIASSIDELAAREVLDGEVATLRLADGAAYVAVEIELGADRTTFRLRETGETREVATDSLAEVAVLVQRGRLTLIGRSTLLGFGIGAAVLGGGIAWMVLDLQSSGSYFPSVGPTLAVLGGVLLTVGGTASGLVHGATTPLERWRVVYRRLPNPIPP